MKQHEIKEKVISAMSLVFEVPEIEINEDTSSDSLENWDSLRHLNLIIALEEVFDISIPDEDVGNMMTYKIILSVITDTLKNGGH